MPVTEINHPLDLHRHHAAFAGNRITQILRHHPYILLFSDIKPGKPSQRPIQEQFCYLASVVSSMPVYLKMALHVNITTKTGVATQIDLGPSTEIRSLRQRMYAMTGFTQETMKFYINGSLVTDELQTIGTFANDGAVSIEVTGQSEVGDLGDTSGVTKFEIADEDYDARKGTIREMKRKMGIPVKGEVPQKEEDPPEGIEVGQRSEVQLADGSHHRGVVRFVGKRDGAKGYWVGVELDEAFGKNNGTVGGKQYFVCEENFGIFVKPAKVKVGDYPVIDWEAELENEM
jgi:tubulin-folding cofactor B